MSGEKIIEGAKAALDWTRGERTARVTLPDGTRGEMTVEEVIERTTAVSIPWAEIARRAQEAKGPDLELGAAVMCLARGGTLASDAISRGQAGWSAGCMIGERPFPQWFNLPNYTGSVDAVLALIAEKLPGWQWLVHSPRSGLSFGASLQDPAPGGRVIVSERGPATAALALLAAFALVMEASDV